MEMIYVKKLYVLPSNSDQRKHILQPAWFDVEQALKGIAAGSIRRIELSDSEDLHVMTIFGKPGSYHISILKEESEESWLSFGSDDKEVEIWGNVFQKDQLCNDIGIVGQIVKCFYNTGDRLSGYNWVTDVR